MKPDNGQLDLERLELADAPELHRALGALKQQLPNPEQLAALAASLSGLGLPVPPPTAGGAKSLGSATRLKLLIGAGLGGPLILALVLWHTEAPRAQPPVTVVISAHPGSLGAPSAAAPSDVAPAARPARVDASRSEPAPASLPVASAAPGAPTEDAPKGKDEAAPPTPALAGNAAPKPSAVSARSPVATDRNNAATLGPGVVARPTELALLRDARIALRTNPSEALALAEQHRSLFAQGAMGQERELIAITALARLGRHTAVLARAAQFERDFPGSPYRKQISLLAQ